MKLTQKTLFQCFEKSSSQSSVVHSSPDSPPCNSQLKTSYEQLESHARQRDFLVPIHIRQSNNSSSVISTPVFNERKTNADEKPSYSTKEFYRICPTIVNDQIKLPKLEFTRIPSTERQTELFQQYTNDQSLIDWKSMFECLQEYRIKAIEQNQYDQLLWTDIYRPKTSKTYLGNHTRQIKRLNEWFSYWTKRLHNDQPKKLVGKKRKRLSDDEDDDDSIENFEDNSNMSYGSCSHSKSEHPQLIFIHGSGTTSLVHALAKEYNFKITEINGSQTRARAPLLKQLEQVTSHHHLSFKRRSSDTIMSQETASNKETLSPLPVKKKAKNEHGSIMSYLNQPKKSNPLAAADEQKENTSRRRSKPTSLNHSELIKLTNKTNLPKRRSKTKQEQSYSPDNSFLSSVQVEKTSLILFDEIETLTTDDNFWSCLKKLLETAKKPIILTSNSRTNPEDAIINLSKLGHYELIHLEQNELEWMCCFLRLILLSEMFEISSLNDLQLLLQSCSCDLRQTLLTLQFLVQSSEITTLSKCSATENHTELSEAKWQSSRIFDAMYYSHLNEQWNESLLGSFFDELTRKYLVEYQQSHRLLLNQSQHDTKRIELYDTFKLFMQEQEIDNITDHPAFYLDYRPYIRQICQSEQNRANQPHSNRRLRHNLTFRGCSLQWPDFEILSTGLD